MKVVLDSAALVSAIRSSSGGAAEIVRLAVVGKLTLLMDLKLVCEYRDVALRPQHKEGVSLNQFINVAVAEKIVHLQHEEWLASRPKPTAERIARVLAILDRPTQSASDPGDELPEGYVSIRDTDEYKQALGTK